MHMIEPMLLWVHGPSGDILHHPFVYTGPLLKNKPLISSAQPIGAPKTELPKDRDMTANLPRYSTLFEPVSIAAYTKNGYKPPLPHILQEQVSLLPSINDRSPRSPIDDYYDDDDFLESVAQLSSGEVKLKVDKVLGKYQVYSDDVFCVSSGLRKCVTVIQEEEKRWMAQLEHDIEREFEMELF